MTNLPLQTILVWNRIYMRERTPEELELLKELERITEVAKNDPNNQSNFQKFLSIANRLEELHPKPIEIGYLSGLYEKGDVPEGFWDKLDLVEESQRHKIGSMGHHTCEYCFPGGDDEMQSKIATGEVDQNIWEEVTSSGENELHLDAYYYRWPDMLRHYIGVHKYLPPQQFIADILSYEPPKQFTEEILNYSPPELPFS